MNTIEEELRQLLADPPRAPRSGADAVDRVRAGIRRRRRHRAAMIGAGALTVVMVGAGVVFGTLVRGPAKGPEPVAPSPTASAIPWRNAPAVEYPEPTWPARPDATPCQAADLTFKGKENNGAGGTLFTILSYANSGAARCTLAGRPTLTGRNSRTGATETVTVKTQTMMPLNPDQVPATIDPGEKAELIIETYGGCLDGRAETTYSRLRLHLPDGAGDLTPSVSINSTCGVGLSEWHRPRAVDTSIDRLAALTVSLEVPERVRVGSPLDFVVILHNGTAADIALSPCPNYLMYLQVKVKLGGGSHQLNCQVSAVPAGGEVRFAMRVDLPNVADLIGATKVVWTMDANGPDGPPTATAPVTITG